MRRIGLILLFGLSLTACTVGIVRREDLTPSISATPAPDVMPTDTLQPSLTPPPIPTDTPEPAPTPSPLPSDAPVPMPTAAPIPLATATETHGTVPVIQYFRADVEEVDPGGTIVFEWATAGATEVTLLHTQDGTWFQSEIELEPSGTFAYEIDTHQEDQSDVFHLRAQDEAGHTTTADLTISVRCLNTWFFSPPPGSCPESSLSRKAAEQHFEHGTMIWVEGNWAEGVSEENWVFVLYDDNMAGPKWATYPDEWEEGDPDRDPTLTPPAGLYQPVRGFGLVWRQNSDVRNRLGWAVDQEAGFSTIIQSTMLFKYNSIYLRALDGNVWHLHPERSGWDKISVENYEVLNAQDHFWFTFVPVSDGVHGGHCSSGGAYAWCKCFADAHLSPVAARHTTAD